MAKLVANSLSTPQPQVDTKVFSLFCRGEIHFCRNRLDVDFGSHRRILKRLVIAGTFFFLYARKVSSEYKMHNYLLPFVEGISRVRF